MPIDPMETAEPVSPEMVAGGSYMPQEDGFEAPPPPEPGIADERALRGRASDVNDFSLTMSGIADGDPVGMETFDLGFFEDGTPSITINGANVPIRHEQWMALLTQRNRTRGEIKARMEFEFQRRKAKDGINRILASAPSVPPQLGEMLLTIADINPGVALQETQQLLVSMAQDNGRTQIGKLSTMIQDTAVATEQQRLDSPIEEPVMETHNGKQFPMYDNNGKPVVRTTSPIRKRIEQLSADPKDKKKQKTAYALSNLNALFPPKGMKSDPAVGGKTVGAFELMLAADGGDTGELSRFDLLRHLAAYSGDLWPSSVEWMDTPVSSNFVPGRPADPNEVARFREYMMRLDEWASKALKWDRSDPRVIDLFVNQSVMGNRVMYNPNAPQPGKSDQGKATDEELDITVDVG